MARLVYGEEFSPAPRVRKYIAALLPSLARRVAWQLFAELNGYGGGWTDITTDRTETPIRTMRGFQSSAPSDLVAQPGTMTFGLDNSAYNALRIQSAYSLDSPSCRTGWRIGIRIKLVATVNGQQITRFVGFLEESAPKEGLYEDQTVSVLAQGWLGQAATAPVATLGAALTQRGDQLLTTATALVAKQPTATVFATGLQTYPYAFDDVDPESGTVMDAIDSIASSGIDRIYERADGALVYETRQTRQTYMAASMTITDVAPVGFPSLVLTKMPTKRSRSQMYNSVRVTVYPRAVDASPTTLYALPISGSFPFIESGATITMNCRLVDPNQQAQGVAGFNMLISNGSGGSMIGTLGLLPAGDYQLGTTAGGGGLDVTATVSVAVQYSATEAIITATNFGASRAYWGLLRTRGQGIYTYQSVQASSSVAASQTDIGQNNVTIDCPYNADALFAASSATYFGGYLATGISQLDEAIEMFVPAEDVATFALLMQREISDAIALSETMTGLNNARYWINAEILEIDERDNTTVGYLLAPNVSGVVWTLGVVGESELGIGTALAW